jgi:hypothetical protein
MSREVKAQGVRLLRSRDFRENPTGIIVCPGGVLVILRFNLSSSYLVAELVRTQGCDKGRIANGRHGKNDDSRPGKSRPFDNA